MDSGSLSPQNDGLPDIMMAPKNQQHATFKSQELEAIKHVAEKFLERSLPNVGIGFDSTEWTHKELYGICLGMMMSYSGNDILKITWIQLLDFIIDVQQGYVDNPYHSFRHAVDVTFVLYYMLDTHNVARFITELDILVLLISALCHDLAHPGLNNLFQVNAKSDLALLYNEISVLENYSCSLTRTLLKKHGLLDNLLREDRKYVLQSIDLCILSTDMTCHFRLLGEFNQMVSILVNPSINTSNINAISSDIPPGSPSTITTVQLPLCDDHRQIIMKLLLHGADISNPCRPWVLCKKWSDMVVAEFFLQGDVEKRISIPVSPNMDRDHSNQVQISLGFCDIIVRPFFESLTSFIPEMQEFVTALESNRVKWVEMKTVLDYKVATVAEKRTLSQSTESSTDSEHTVVTAMENLTIERNMSAQSLEDSIKQLRTALEGRRVSVAAGVIHIPDNVAASLSSTKPKHRKISYEYVGNTTGTNSKASSARHSAVNLHRVSGGAGAYFNTSPHLATVSNKNGSKTSLHPRDFSEFNTMLGSNNSVATSNPSSNHSSLVIQAGSRRGSFAGTEDDSNSVSSLKHVKRRNSHTYTTTPLPPMDSPATPVSPAESATAQSVQCNDRSGSKSSPSPPKFPQDSVNLPAASPQITAEKQVHMIRLCRPRNHLYRMSTRVAASSLQAMLFRSKLESIIIPRNLNTSRETIISSMLPLDSMDGNYRTIHRSNKIYEHITNSRRTRPSIPLQHILNQHVEAGTGDASGTGDQVKSPATSTSPTSATSSGPSAKRHPFIDTVMYFVHAGEIHLPNQAAPLQSSQRRRLTTEGHSKLLPSSVPTSIKGEITGDLTLIETTQEGAHRRTYSEGQVLSAKELVSMGIEAATQILQTQQKSSQNDHGK